MLRHTNAMLLRARGVDIATIALMARAREHQDHPDLRARRPRAQRASDRTNRPTRHQARPIPTIRHAARVPRRALIMLNDHREIALSKEKRRRAGRVLNIIIGGTYNRLRGIQRNGFGGGQRKRSNTATAPLAYLVDQGIRRSPCRSGAGDGQLAGDPPSPLVSARRAGSPLRGPLQAARGRRSRRAGRVA